MPNQRYSYFYPTRVEYGPDVVQELPSMIKETGLMNGLLVTDQGLESTGIPDQIRQIFGESGMELVTFNDVKSNPTCDNVYDGTDFYKEKGAQFVVALGGGSPMDVGKTIKVLATHDGPLEQYDDALDGNKLIQNNMPPFYAIPTTAGTGSEVGRSSVITVKATNKKTIIFSPFMLPNIAVLDPVLTVGLPPGLTAATGVDAFVHNLEAYWVDAFHPFADGIAHQGMKLCFDNLETAVGNGQDISARGNMLMASSMGATAFQKGLGVNHSIAHALGVFYDIHHGLANAALLIGTTQYNMEDEKAWTRLASIGSSIGVANKAEHVLETIESWLHRLNLPTDLKSFNIDANDIGKIEQYALSDPTCPTNSRKVQRGDIIRILERLI
ncbi:MAG: iron-containing alcohol dehydrogenase [Candidatus Marinimicrobia bacterium]|nr:alcohol dehydrogenase [Acidiferrobacteraceae bacterium]MDP6032908.1 iron-containing alcohol dehydrogenase [Candidatus Neomarinimicrobiota bacterium]|tara:strand:- start:5171 stop:6322 length:1152 start_codon:yes stop_codon:yes gene_type:complete